MAFTANKFLGIIKCEGKKLRKSDPCSNPLPGEHREEVPGAKYPVEHCR